MTCALINPFAGNWLHEGEASIGSATIAETTDAASGPSTTYTMAAGDTFLGSLDGFDTFGFADWDWIAINLSAGVQYTITMTGGTLSNPFLELFLGTSSVATDDDSAGDLDAQIVYTPPSSATYYIAADSFGAALNGTYSVSVTNDGQSPSPILPGTDDPVKSIDWGYTAPSVIDVYFVPGGVTYDDGTAQTTSAWSAFDQQQAMLAFQQYSNVANVTFNVTTDPNQAEFFMVESTDPNSSLGYWWIGGQTVTLNGVSYTLDGVGVHYSGGAGWDSNGLQQGGFGFITLLHEIGHGMGLAHPHDDGGNSTVMNGVSEPFNDLGEFDLNQGIYTTMTYNDGWRTAPHGTTPSNNYGHQGTPMAFDIAALQADYGANMSYNTGNDTYVLPTVNAIGTFYSALWDAGGIDTIVHNGNSSAVIDLREAPLTYDVNGGGYVSYVQGIHGGFTIAAGAVIENASGGDGADTIVGNEAANLIQGFQGADSIEGGDGDDELRGNLNGDTINGGAGFDQIYGNFGFDSLYGGTFADSIYGGNQDDRIWGELGNDLLIGQGDNDTIWGGDGFDTIRGGADDDVLYGGDRGDNLIGGIGNDTLYGEAGNDRLDGNQGTDLLEGGDGQDALYGGDANDTLLGGADNDRIFAGADDDLINGGTGNDTIFGSTGVDTFVFEAGHGDDVIRDFDANGELIDLTALGTNIGALTIAADAAGTLVTTPDGTILLEGVAVGDVTGADFLF